MSNLFECDFRHIIWTVTFIKVFIHIISMPYTATDQEVEEFNKFRLGFNEVDVKTGPDRFRMGYHEVCLEAFNSRSMYELAESLEDNGFRLVDGEAGGLTYYSPDGKTEIYLDEVPNARDPMCRVMILRGELSEGTLPLTEQQLRALYSEL